MYVNEFFKHNYRKYRYTLLHVVFSVVICLVIHYCMWFLAL